MMPVTAFTTASLADLDRVTVLMESLRKCHPDWRLVLVLVDEPPTSEALRAELARMDDVLVASGLMGEGSLRWFFGHGRTEGCAAIKGRAMHELLARSRGPVVYLALDTIVLDSLDPAIEPIATGGLALSPYRLSPQTSHQAGIENEIDTLRRGIYSTGFLAVSRRGSGTRFTEWYMSRSDRLSQGDLGGGLDGDQRIIDQVPNFFPDTVVVRDPGMGVAVWNLDEREISLSRSGNYLVNGEPLRLVRFSQPLDDDFGMMLRWGSDNVHVAEIWRYYRGRTSEVRDRLPAPEWAYDRYTNGDMIQPEHRRRYRSDPSLRARFPDPFAMSIAERPQI